MDEARNLIASLVTRRRGEFICHLGLRPPSDTLYANTPLDITDTHNWIGSAISAIELTTIRETITKLAEEVGVVVSVLFTATDHDRARCALLLRLPPASVSTTPEVRCAVVGNVDSGKSTTLGVLTRGGLDDGRGRARVGLFRHKHEIETGRTSSVGMEVSKFHNACEESVKRPIYLLSRFLALTAQDGLFFPLCMRIRRHTVTNGWAGTKYRPRVQRLSHSLVCHGF